MMKKWIIMILAALLCLVGVAMAEAPWDTDALIYQEGDVVVTDAEREAGYPVFVITMADGAVMRGVLYPDIAPESVGNFIALANSGYYDGRLIHRVIPGFVIQGGSPYGNGIGGAGWSIKGEFGLNGVQNDLQHTYGVLSMARAQAYDSAGSQFFICMGDVRASLDDKYAGFGLVTEGMDVAESIVAQQRDASDKPLADQVIQSVRVETFGVEYPFEKLN